MAATGYMRWVGAVVVLVVSVSVVSSLRGATAYPGMSGHTALWPYLFSGRREGGKRDIVLSIKSLKVLGKFRRMCLPREYKSR